MNLKQLQTQLFQGATNSVTLVQQAISRYQETLSYNPVGVISPKAMHDAHTKDEERKLGKIKGPLHGIPILIKDNILYSDGTPTTANSYALKDFYPHQHATLVQSLIDAGAIILGKANLSEFAYFMGDEKTPSGYGSMYGQVKHPVDNKIDPYGSSTGSAVAIALGIVTIAIGTETNGSLMAPAFQTQTVAFKPTVGMISRHGIIPISPSQDTAGPMTTNVYDCAVLMDVMAHSDDNDRSTQTIVRPTSFVDSLQHSLNNQRIAYLRWSHQPYDSIQETIFQQSKSRWQSLGHEVIEVDMVMPALDNYPTLLREFKVSMNEFLTAHQHEGAPSSLADIIRINLENPDRCLRYGQHTLIESESMPNGLDDLFDNMKQALIKEAQPFEHLFTTKGFDLIVTPTWFGFAPILGLPSLVLPMGYTQRQPTGLILVGPRGHDAEVLQLGYQFFGR